MLRITSTTEIIETLEAIRKHAEHDDEAAHSLEDDLYEAVLVWISKNSTDALAAAMAKYVLQTKELTFARHCA